MRALVLCHEGAPMLVSMSTARPIKARIIEWPDDDAELWSVWSVPTDDTMTPAQDITKQFAETWSMEFSFGSGLKPEEYLSPFPAFVVEHARNMLVARWNADMTVHPPIELPNPLKRSAA